MSKKKMVKQENKRKNRDWNLRSCILTKSVACSYIIDSADYHIGCAID